MHNLYCVRIYQTIALDLLNYIDSYQLQEELSTHNAIYPLYYVQNFTDWNQAFQYLQSCSQNVFRIVENKGNSRNNSTIEKIQKYIQSNLHEQLNLSNIAALVSYNETYVSRLFKQNTGMKISDYILQERLSKAKQLLSTTEQSINTIAENCGFDSIHYFSYTFKKNMGISPSDYRRNSRA
ncbi:MAG: AraC family transcriptional regulator [Lachnospiraceae bacterium]|nr:AraC family transcriptional regulator [Lachnospiraceae bacterium]MDE7201104.1 AraC family transcriptional regulator [Lachnospiraceae bacterium]